MSAEQPESSHFPNTLKTLLRILPLSNEAISQIHSSKHITSLEKVVLCLVENALDAEATKVDITIDWLKGACSVDDNGIGIPHHEFAENGGLARMYCTSKRAPVGTMSTAVGEVHGSTGTFLAQLAAVSLLSITSTHGRSTDSASLTIHHGKAISRRLPGLTTTDGIPRSGTNVAVRDLFGNMPVRVKQRALFADGGSGGEKKWLDLKRGVAALLLAWPRPCSVTLRDAKDTSKVLRLSGHHPSVGGFLTEKGLNQLAGKTAKFDLRDALPLIFQAGLADPDSKQRWIPLSASTPSVSLKGLICLNPAPTKQCQFVSVGVQPSETADGSNDLYNVINRIFANSSFGTDETPNDPLDTGGKSWQPSTARLHARSKGIDRYPMFCVQLTLKEKFDKTVDNDLGNMSDASLKVLLDVVEAAITAWLSKHHFRPRKRRRRNVENSDAPQSPSASSSKSAPTEKLCITHTSGRAWHIATSEPEHAMHEERLMPVKSKRGRIEGAMETSNFERALPRSEDLQGQPGLQFLSRIRAGNTAQRPQSAGDADHAHSRSVQQRPDSQHLPRDAENSTSFGLEVDRSDDFGSLDEEDILAAIDAPSEQSRAFEGDALTLTDDQGEDNVVTWTDPVSRQTFRVNSRTGVVLPCSTSDRGDKACLDDDSARRPRAGIDTGLSSAGKPLSLARRQAVSTAKRPKSNPSERDKWLPGFLEEWNNPVFAPQAEEPIPKASTDGPGLLELDDDGKCCSHDASGRRLDPVKAGSKLSKAALQHAKVIAQVDRKFILCKMPAAGSQDVVSDAGRESDETLVLVDQHAASERITLENVLTELLHIDKNDLTGISATSLSHTSRGKPLHFDVSLHEYELFNRYQRHFTTWGISYTTSSIGTDDRKPSHRLTLTHLPTLIASRCATVPTLAIDLLRSELWVLADGSKRPLSSLPEPRTSEPEPAWLNLLPLIPTKLLEMLHSRSCRSAVMFNDVLSKEECEDLMAKLAHSVFSFVCAHGRCAMVPIMEIAGEDDGRSGRELAGETICRAQDLGKWMRSKG